MPDLTINGHKLHYEETGSGESMIFLNHLSTLSAKTLVSEMEYASDFRVIIPDARGLGESAHVTEWSPGGWEEDLLGLLDALSIPSAHIMGETVGSRVALRFAADHPERVKSLILDAAIAISEPAGDEWRRNLLNPATAAPAFAERMHAMIGDDWKEVLNFFVSTHDRDDYKRYYDGYEAATKIKAPTLIVHGDTNSSAVYPLEHSEELHRLIPGSWLAVYPNKHGAVRAEGHIPEEYWRLTRQFIKEMT